MASLTDYGHLECGNLKGSSKEIRPGRTAHNVSSSSLRKKSDLTLVSKVRFALLRQLLTNLQEVVLGTKLSVLFPAIPLAIVAQMFNFGRVSVAGVFSVSVIWVSSVLSFHFIKFIVLGFVFFVSTAMGVCVEYAWAHTTCRAC